MFGLIGKRVGKIAETLGMKIMVAKNTGEEYAKNDTAIGEDGILRYELDEVLEKCDVLTLHVPLTDSTRNLINLEKMKKMKRN